jgi:hypothetical protein
MVLAAAVIELHDTVSNIQDDWVQDDWVQDDWVQGRDTLIVCRRY